MTRKILTTFELSFIFFYQKCLYKDWLCQIWEWHETTFHRFNINKNLSYFSWICCVQKTFLNSPQFFLFYQLLNIWNIFPKGRLDSSCNPTSARKIPETSIISRTFNGVLRHLRRWDVTFKPHKCVLYLYLYVITVVLVVESQLLQ